MARILGPMGWIEVLSETVQNLDEETRELVRYLVSENEDMTEGAALELVKKLEKQVDDLNKDYDDELDNIINEVFENLDEVSRTTLKNYVGKTGNHSGDVVPGRKKGRAMALNKMWGDPNYGFKDNPKVPADGKWPQKK